MSIIYILFIAIILYYEYSHITNNFLEEHQVKNQYIKKATDSFFNYLRDDVTKKSDFITSNKKVTQAFYEKDREALYKELIPYYNRQTTLNKYLKIMTFRLKDGSTFLRVHKPEMYGDKLNQKRKIIIDTNRLKVRHYGFEVGKLKMTYRVVTPIFHNGEHIGLIEIGIEPEYIVDKLTQTFDMEDALLVKKENLSVLLENNKSFPIIDDFALVRGSDFFTKETKNINLDTKEQNFVEYNSSYYLIEKNLNLYDHNDNITAKLLFASKINNFESRNKTIITNAIFLSIFMILLYIIINFLINQFLKIQEEQKNEIDAIFNGASSILVLSDGESISNANDSFFKFFNTFKDIKHFKSKYDCICDKFEPIDKPNYISSKTINGEVWSKYILSHPNEIYKAAIKKDDKLYHFLVNINEVKFTDKVLHVIDFSDITSDVEKQKKIDEQSKLIINQTKMAALGEMIGNIAHQWRQPLSVISTAASGMKLQKELGILDDDILYNNLDSIMNNTKFLSQTIDDFRDFIKGEKHQSEFNISDCILKSINILKASLDNNYIKQINNLQNIKIQSYENELIQALNNIINNAKDAMKELDLETKYLFCNSYVENNYAIITIQDNAGGIPDDIMDKIFEPYFTTKHQSQGTGLGLYMTHQIITESLMGEIFVENVSYEYEDVNYTGARFTIKIPLIIVKEV